MAQTDADAAGEGEADGVTAERYKVLQALDMRTMAFTDGGMEAPGARDDWAKGDVGLFLGRLASPGCGGGTGRGGRVLRGRRAHVRSGGEGVLQAPD